MHRVSRSVFTQYFAFAILASLSLLLAAFTPPAHAQTDTTVDPLTLDVSPQYPAPYQTLTITPSSTVFNISSASLTVTVNGATFYKGSGGAAIAVPLSGPGSTTNISVVATAAGQTYTKKLSIHPAAVALVVEPVSTTHPFYAGKALVPSQGRVRLIAIADLRSSSGQAISPSNLVYTWSLGAQVLDGDSGIGRSVLDAAAPERYRDADVSVVVSSQDGSLVAKAETTISPVDPITRVYEEDPLLGPLFDTALSNTFKMSSAEDTFLGVPYYFSNTPTLSWSVNGTDSGTQSDITVRSTGNGSGTATVAFSANDTSSSLTANSTVSVQFGQQSSGGFLGL